MENVSGKAKGSRATPNQLVIEYVDLKGDLHERAQAVFSAMLNGKLEGVFPHPILAETYRAAAKLYRKLRVENPRAIASKLAEWLYRLPAAVFPGKNVNLTVEAGKAKLAQRASEPDFPACSFICL